MKRLTSGFHTTSTSKCLKILLLFLWGTYAVNAGAATVTWDGDAGDGLWGTAANWDGDILPSTTDDVVIDNGDAVTLASGAVTVNTVTLSSGSDLSISSGATLNVYKSSSTGRAIDLDGSGVILTNAGNLNISGGNSSINLTGATLTNLSGGTIDLSTSYYGINANGGSINNTGTITKASGSYGIFADVGASISNNAGGDLTFANSSIAGIDLQSADLANYGSLTISGGSGTGINYYNNQGANWSNAGTINVSNTGGTGVFVGDVGMSNTGTMTITNAGADGLYLAGVAFSNAGNLIISGSTGNALNNDLSGTFTNTGTLQGIGTFDTDNNNLDGTIAPGTSPGTMTFPADQTITGTLEVEINGTTPDTEHDQIIVNGTATLGGTLNATINYTPTIGDRIVIISATSISGTFTSVNPPLPGPWSLDYSVPGEVALLYDYTPGLWDGDAGDGLWNTAANWDGDLLPTPTDDVVIDNGDAVTLASGTVTVQSIKLDGNSDLSVSAGATLNVIGTNFRPVDVRFCYSCVITNSGTINVDGGGRGIDTYSNLFNNNGATINIINNASSGIRVSAAKILSNSGTITITGPVSGGLNVDNFYNNASGNFTLTDENSGVYADFFWNYGSFTLQSTADGLTSSTELANFSTGTLNISVGSSSDAISTPVFFNSGTVAGNGTYTFYNTQNHTGILAPGNSPGTMTFQGDQTFQAANTLQMEIDGTMPDTEHDQIIVNGTLTLDGTLDATINYPPSGPDRIVLISATSISGTFSSINPVLPSNWMVDYSVPGEVALVYDYQDGLWDGDAGDGLWSTAANWDGDILPSSTADVVIDNGDAVTLPSGTINVKSISLDNGADLTIADVVDITIGGFSSIGINIPFSCSDCIFTNDGIVTITGGNIGLLSGSPIMNNGVMIISGSSNSGIFSYSNLTNSGLLNLTGPFSYRGLYLEGSATNTASGNIVISNTGQGGIEHFGPPFTNQGSISVSGGTVGFQTSDIVNSGTINITGTSNLALNVSTSIDNLSGTLVGDGSFQLGGSSVPLDLDGTVRPDYGGGTMTFTDDQTFTASSTLNFAVGSTTNHTQIIVNGTATIGGALDAFIPYSSPTIGDRIVIISATAVSGTFSSDNLPLYWSIDYSVSGEVALVYFYQDGLWDGDAGDGLWTTAANWDGDILPSTTADVVIDNGDAVTLPSGTVTVHTVSISNSSDLTVSAGATLNVNNSGFNNTVYVSGFSSEVIVAGTVNITGGSAGVNLENADWTTQPGGQVNISAYSGNGFSSSSGGGDLANAGTMTITGGVRGISMSGGILNNNAGGVLTVENASNGGIFVPGSGDLSNNGTIQVNNCGGTSVFATWIGNSGTISISNAGSRGIYGVVDLFNSGTITIMGATGVGVYGDDTNYNNSGTIAISGTSGYAFNFDDNGYPYTFSNTGTLQGIGTFDMAGNALGGTIIPGTSTGTMTYPVSQTFASTMMEFEVNGTTPDTEHDQIIVAGTATISGTLNASINYTPSNGDRIVLLSATSVSGTFSSINPALPYDWDVDYSVPGEVALVYAYTIGRWDGEVGDGLWTSADNWEGGVLPTSSVDVIIDNGDAVTLPSGTVTVHTVSISNNSDLSVSAGATLNVNNSGFNNTVYVSGYSSAVIVGGTVNITGGNAGVNLENADWTTQSGGQANISSYSGTGFSHSSGGYLTNAGTMTITGGVRGISMSGGILNNNAGGVLTVENTSNGGISVPGSGDLSNNGTIQVNNCGGTSVSATWINNYGTISISNAGSIGIYGVADLFNAGTITITGATGVGVYGDDSNFSNSGTIAISGTGGYAFNFDDNGYPYTFSNTGTLQGAGTFDMAGNTLGGTIIPGTSTGTMTYPVSQTFSSTTMEFEINGTTPDTEHDQIIVTGTATISGALDATISYLPAMNDRIVIISATAISGTFSSDNLPMDWSIDYSQTGEVALVYSGVSLPIEISGVILWEHDGMSGVKNANVALSGDDTDSDLTDVNGAYALTASNGSNFTITPTKNSNKLNGITVADAVAIQQHLTLTNPITSPYKQVAADVNKSNSITTFDATIINQSLLGNPAALAQFKTAWRFVPTDFTLSIPPWGFPEKINLTGVNSSTPNQDFWGIKTGDLVSTYANPANLLPHSPLVLRTADAALQAGQEIHVAFQVEAFDDLAAWQFALRFDPTQLDLMGIERAGQLPLTDEHFGLFNISEGEIRTVWAQAEGLALQAGEGVLLLKFNVLQSGGRLSDAIRLDEAVLPAYAYDSKLEESGVELLFDQASNVANTENPALAMEVWPNPFVERTTLRFYLPEACVAQVRVMDNTGRELWRQRRDYPAGWQQEVIQLNVALAGVLFCELTTPQSTQTVQVVRVE